MLHQVIKLGKTTKTVPATTQGHSTDDTLIIH